MSEGLVEAIVARHDFNEHALIAVLQEIQRRRNWLPPPDLDEVARLLRVAPSRVFGIASFYKAFSLVPRGRHVVQVCTGTACHVRNAQQILDRLSRELRIDPGGTTPDLRFTLERVRCLGCCSIAPVARVGENTHGRLTQHRAATLLKKYR
ncbi:MAG: NADH-quinone oxidoreductase subunit NuoE [Deltaproteobacteria bacterium]|nr:NADH-quinone oxidoreductase subunit NuoE [Deltaproteobacteria bacterium]